ncbi:MAG: hypothetical protein IJV45_08040 [Prevotella sp.]|nr:hypothetical protein [Prevotella sp.]
MKAYAKSQELLKAINLAKQIEGVDISEQETVYRDESASTADLDAATKAVYEAIRANVTAGTAVDMTSLLVNPSFDGCDVTTGWDGTGFRTLTFKEGENAVIIGETYDTHQTVDNLPAGVYAVGVNALYLTPMSNIKEAYRSWKTGSVATQRARLYASQGDGCDIGELEIRSPFSTPATQPTEGLMEGYVVDDASGQTLWIPDDQRAAEYYMHTLGSYGHRLFVTSDGSAMTIGVRDIENQPEKFAMQMWPDGASVTYAQAWSVFDDFTLTYYGDSPEAYQMMFDEERLNYGDGSLGEDTLCTDSYREAYRKAWGERVVTNKAEADAAIAAIADAHTALRVNILLWNTWSQRIAVFFSPWNYEFAEKNLTDEQFKEYTDLLAKWTATREARSLTNDELLKQICEAIDLHFWYFSVFIEGMADVRMPINPNSKVIDLQGRRVIGTPGKGVYIMDGRKFMVK